MPAKVLQDNTTPRDNNSMKVDGAIHEEVETRLIEDAHVLKTNLMAKKKNKQKKSKKGETDKQNISVKSSFSKFDALQKRSLIHVRSIDASTAQEKFSNPQGDVQQNCRLCDKAVYKMEEIKAEKNIYHRNCFRCKECNKQLKVDTYQSHEGILYCIVHFKLLFAPKSVTDNNIIQPCKPELIIRENQPTELPPDVVRASDKPDLGLEELHQLNVRSRFQAFEQGKVSNSEDKKHVVEISDNGVGMHSATVLPKVGKLQQLYSNDNVQQDLSVSSDNNDEYEAGIDFSSSYENQKKHDQKSDFPVGIGEAINDIRTLFEKGHGMKREERREERKQEIQNIRSRLFMGKQARIKEMYQQAVAESENAPEIKPNINIEVDSKSLRQLFENGEIFKGSQSENENDGAKSRKPAIEKEADVFESAISKKSRSIFMELDANVVNGKNYNAITFNTQNRTSQTQKVAGSASNRLNSEVDNEVVKYSESVEDIKIKTSEISEKFNFFEKYHLSENKKNVFRITPPREGVVKTPSHEEIGDANLEENSPDRNIIAHSRTTSMMLNKFRELEKKSNCYIYNSPKPLKSFTPPPEDNRRFYDEDSDEYESDDDDDDDEEAEEDGDDFIHYSQLPKDDEALKQAQNAARAKQLRIKFEKWQTNEIRREENEVNQSGNKATDDTSIESTQSIRDRFEKMHNCGDLTQPVRPRYQVNRFV